MAADTGSARPFVGRSEVVDALRRDWEAAKAGHVGVTLLLGGSGVGKSELIHDLARELRSEGATVLYGRALAVDEPPPFSLVRAAIASARAGPSDPEVEPGGAQLARGAGAPPVGTEQWLIHALEQPDAGGESWRERVLNDIAQHLGGFLALGPVALFLDDLHHADDSSLSALRYLVERLSDHPLWVLATSRLYASLSQSGRTRLERFEEATHAHSVPLRPMTSDEVADFLRLYEPNRTFSPEEVARRFSETAGNPRLLGQLASAPAARPVPSTGGVAPPSTLEPTSQRLLDVAAVLGPEFPFALLRRASGEPDDERFLEQLRRLKDGGWLIELPGELLAFPEDRLREEAYAKIPESRRRTLHWSVGEALEGMGGSGVATTYSLARHFYLGRVRGKSVKYNRQAAEIADRAHAADVARDHLVRALRSLQELGPPNIEEEADLVQELARVSEELGLLPDAERLVRDFLDREKATPRLPARRRANLEILLARILTDRGDMPAASELARKVLATPGLDDQPLVQVGAHHQLGMALYYTGHYADAVTQHTEEIRRAQKLGNPLLTLRAQVWRLASLAMMGPTAEAVSEARQVTIARDRLGSPRESAQAHLFFGDLLADARCTPAQRREAVDQYAEAIRHAEKAQDPRRVGWALYKTAELLRESGGREKATEKVDEACEIFTRIGDQVGLALATKVRGQIALDQGAYERAAVDLNQSYHLIRGLERTLEELDVVLRLAQLAHARGDLPGARQLVVDLDRQGLARVRPDLVAELEELRRELGGGENAAAS